MRSRPDSATRFVVAIVTVGLVAFLVVVFSGVTAARRLGETLAVEQARAATETEARVVESRLSDGVVSGDVVALGHLALLVEQAVKSDPTVERVKIWSVDDGVGTIIYSDLGRLIGTRENLWDEVEVLRTGDVVAEVTDLADAENRSEQELSGAITEVYTRIETPGGTPLVFETYRSSALIASSGRQIAYTFIPVLVLTLLTAAAVEVLLAVALIRRIRRGQRVRESLMVEAMQASFRERRRIAGDLHDGPVQEMAGLSLGLAAQAETVHDARTHDLLVEAAGMVRGSVRALRSAIVGVYPPNLEQMGLQAALSDLLARLPSHQITGHLDYELDTDVRHRASELLYRTGQEAIRNVEKHAGASNVWVSVQRHNGAVALSVRDDGHGGAAVNEQLGESGRFGLAVLCDIVRDAGGHLRLTSDDAGTTVRVEVPV